MHICPSIAAILILGNRPFNNQLKVTRIFLQISVNNPLFVACLPSTPLIYTIHFYRPIRLTVSDFAMTSCHLDSAELIMPLLPNAAALPIFGHGKEHQFRTSRSESGLEAVFSVRVRSRREDANQLPDLRDDLAAVDIDIATDMSVSGHQSEVFDTKGSNSTRSCSDDSLITYHQIVDLNSASSTLDDAEAQHTFSARKRKLSQTD